jgi:hypothetical protein
VLRTLSAPRVAAVLAGLALAAAVGPSPARAARVDAGALRAVVDADPFALRFVDAADATVLAQAASTGAGPAGTLGYQRAGAWYHATSAAALGSAEDGVTATLRTTDPLGGTIALRVARTADGVVRVEAQMPADATAAGIGFDRRPGERFLGFGERSDAVVRASGDVQSRVTEGPYQPAEEPLIAAFVPLPGYNVRADATYFPIPWLLSSRGYGVLVEGGETTTHHLGSPWSIETDGHRLAFDVYAGPTPAAALARFTTRRSRAARRPTAGRPTARRGPTCTTAIRPCTTAPPMPTSATARRDRSRASTARGGPARPPCRRSCGAAIRPRAGASTAWRPRSATG